LRGLYEQLYKEGKQKEVIQVAALLHKVNEHLPKLQKCYQAQAAYCLMLCRELRPVSAALFEREHDALTRTGDVKARRALQRVRKRWNDNKAFGDSDRRTLEILKMLRDKVINAAWVKGGASDGYTEAAFGGDRALSDEAWAGRLTVREIHSRLMTAGGSRLAGDKDGKEIRRTMRRLGIRPAEDQRGRKWKPPYPEKQKPKRPRGRPRTKPEIKSMSLEATEAMLAKTAEQGDGLRNQQIYKAGDESGLKWAKQVLKSIDREIAQLVQRRGGRRGKFVY
jgi:hypothetical protein